MAADEITLNTRQIMDVLPHRYPFLLIDRITACVPGKSITAVKNVSINEPFFPGHFPGNPVWIRSHCFSWRVWMPVASAGR